MSEKHTDVLGTPYHYHLMKLGDGADQLLACYHPRCPEATYMPDDVVRKWQREATVEQRNMLAYQRRAESALVTKRQAADGNPGLGREN
jgi:hypothetical protein